MIKQIKLVVSAISILVVSACSSSGPVMMGDLDTQSLTILNGKIVSIESVEVSAPLFPRIIGTVVGSNLVRNFGGNGVARVTAGVAGSVITNKIYDLHADKITIITNNDKEFQTIVPTGYFTVSDTIRFTVDENDIEAIERHETVESI